MQVFISYSSLDRVEALKIKALVDELGHDAWMDVFDIRAGAPLAAELEQKVKTSGAVLLLLSPFAVESPWVNDEIGHAREAQVQGSMFVPILLRPARIPDSLGDLVAIDATRGLEEETFRLRLARALGGEVDPSLILNAETRAALSDRAFVVEAEAAFTGIKEDLQELLDQPLRRLNLVIDQHTWPTRDDCMLQLQLRVDIFMGDASVFVAPYREGRTWPEHFGFDERAPEEFFGQPKPRVDARFRFLGRSFELRPTGDGTDMGELPVQFAIELDGSEFTGEERAGTMLIAERFELPVISALMKKRSTVTFWRHTTGQPPVAVDPRATDIEMRLYATIATTGVTRELRLWSSRRSREEMVLERCQTLAECESPIEREILLDAFYPRPLRQSRTAGSRRERIGAALDQDEPIPQEDGWAAFRMMRGASNVLAIRGQYPQAAQELHKALSLLPENLTLDREPYGAVFEYWNALMRLAALLDKAGGRDEALRFYADEAVRTAEQAAESDPQEPDFRSAVVRALIHRVRLFQRRFGTVDVRDLDRAELLIDALARETALPWRAQEAEQTRTQTAELRVALSAQAAEATVTPPAVFARWLDPAARAKEEKVLLISELLRYSAFVSERVPWGGPELHLIGNEIAHLYRSDTKPGWFGVSVAETRSDDPQPATENTLLMRAPFTLAAAADWTILKWEPTEAVGDLIERLELKQTQAVRALVRQSEDLRLRIYFVEARSRLLRWMVALALPWQSDDWRELTRDDASAAITFSRLNLG
jgi:tetratricopeptide (TPR) repeat protein